MKHILYLVIFLFTLQIVNSQSRVINKADKYFDNGDFYSASYLYKQALNKMYNKNLAYKYAEACRLNYDYKNAETYYKKLSYDADFNKPMLYYNLAMVQKGLGKYQLAQRNFNKFLNKYERNDFYKTKAKHEYISCKKALEMSFAKDYSINLSHCDTSINSIYGELKITDLNGVKYFTALRPDLTDTVNTKLLSLLYSVKQNVKKEVIFQPNDTSNIPNFCFNIDKTKIYFTKCKQKNKKLRCYIYKGDFSGDKVTGIKKLSSSVNFPGYNSTQPYITKYRDKELLFFASNRQDGFGKYDIWVSEIYEDGGNASAKNLGKNINSVDNEISPYYDAEKEQLYFSSEWYANFGGFDIFKANGNPDYFNEPENMGMPINSSYNDYYFNINNEYNRAYLSTNREGVLTDKTGNCCNDFYSYPVHKQEVPEIVDVKKIKTDMRQLIPITLYFHNDEPNPRTRDTTTQFTYDQTYTQYIKMLEEYETEYSKGTKGDKQIKAIETIDNFFSDKVEKGYSKLVNFAVLMRELLDNGEKIKITIKGFASPLNSTDYNINLSKRRIQSLVNYFETFDNGYFKKYITGTAQNGGKITFERIAFGEDTADLNISDDLSDLKNSVYSPDAANERKIKVLAVSFGK